VKIAILGAESTGKSTLSHGLAAALTQAGSPATAVNEYLREWCLANNRTPLPAEQAAIAREQARRIDAASGIVVADTTPLMTAIYSDVLFADVSLYPMALAHLASFTHVLVTALDLPWVADGFLRDGPAGQSAIHQRLQAVLEEHNIAHAMVYGRGEQRLRAARAAVMPANEAVDAADAQARTYQRWISGCEKCSDSACEHTLFKSLTTGL